MVEERLQKIISRAGYSSRRGAERLILAGRVTVNGVVVDRLGTKADPGKDRIEIDGRPMNDLEALAYFLMYKPVGFITSLKDPRGRPTIADMISGLGVRLFPVGRLDRDTEGLLVLTNDGELARRLMHPGYHVPKTYRVKVEGRPGPEKLERLASGKIILGDRPVAPAEVAVIKNGSDRTWLHLTLIEGRNRQVRRMCGRIGHPVLKLKRISYGPLTLDRMKPGDIRRLSPAEVASLKRAVGLEK